MKQFNLFPQDVNTAGEQKYTSKIKTPVYEPKNRKPHVLELFDDSKTKRIVHEIELSTIPADEKRFLIESAKRHTIFNYERIADYYAHSNPEMQKLMERSALVIIDFEKAIELGYVRLCESIESQFLQEYGE